MDSEIEFSVIVPVYNSEGSINELSDRLHSVMEGLGRRYELIFVDDGSGDLSWEKLINANEGRSFIRLIRLKKNFGQISSTICGIHQSNGKWLITLDDDLQFPPSQIPQLIDFQINSGKKWVFGYPEKRKHGFAHLVLAKIGAFVLHSIFFRRFRKVNFFSTFRLFDRDLFLDSRGRPKDRHLFFLWEFPPEVMAHVKVNHAKRVAGKSTYTFRKLLKYYAPFLVYMARQGVRFFSIILLLFVIPFLALSGYEGKIIGIAAIVFVGLILVFVGFVIKLKELKKVEYEIAEERE